MDFIGSFLNGIKSFLEKIKEIIGLTEQHGAAGAAKIVAENTLNNAVESAVGYAQSVGNSVVQIGSTGQDLLGMIGGNTQRLPASEASTGESQTPASTPATPPASSDRSVAS